jgi:hypothetical protein
MKKWKWIEDQKSLPEILQHARFLSSSWEQSIKRQYEIAKPQKLATSGTQDTEKHNTICVTHHYAQTNTNNVNKTWDQNNSASDMSLDTQKEFEDTKGVIRIRISKKNRQHKRGVITFWGTLSSRHCSWQ